MRWLPLCVILLVPAARAGDGTEDEATLEILAARRAMEAQLKRGDLLRDQGQLDAALAEYRKALKIFDEAMARAAPPKKEEEAGGGAGKEEAVPVDDGTPAGRRRVVDYHLRILQNTELSAEVRYQAGRQLGEMRAVEARDALMNAVQHDEAELVRRVAAWDLGRLGKDGVPAVEVLIAQVGSDKQYVGLMAHRALGDIAEAVLGSRPELEFKPTMTQEERTAIQGRWQEWYAAHREELEKPAGEKDK